MRQHVALAIVLSRTDYGEADRVLTVLTPEFGKLSLLAKGVRRVKSKLAGGIELFSVSDITFIRGRAGGMGTLTSSRLVCHYGNIVSDLERTMLGYELIKELHRVTEDEVESEYFELLRAIFEALADGSVSLPLARLWFEAQLLQLGGRTPNLRTDNAGNPLQPDARYDFAVNDMAFSPQPHFGKFNARHIKLLRLAFMGRKPQQLARIEMDAELARICLHVTRAAITDL